MISDSNHTSITVQVNMIAFKLFGALCFVTVICGSPSQNINRSSRNAIQTEDDLLEKTHADCLHQNSIECMKYKLFNFVEKSLDQKDTITVTDGVQIVKTAGSDIQGAPRAISDNDNLDSVILNRMQKYLDSHAIKVDLKGSDIAKTVSSVVHSFEDFMDGFTDDEGPVEEGRKKKKKVLKLLGPLLAAAAAKAIIVKKIAIAAVGLLAAKALIVAKIALAIGIASGVRALISGVRGSGGGQGGQEVYEVIAHPQYSTSHVSSHDGGHDYHHGGGHGDGGSSYGSSGHGGWGRAYDAQNLVYRGYNKEIKSNP